MHNVRRLELGSGFKPTDGYEHLDVNPNAPHVEFVCSAFDPLPFDDATFDELLATDCLEHTSYQDTARVLAEWARICKSGGVLRVQVPSAGDIMRWYAEGDQRLCRWVNPRTGRNEPTTLLNGAQWRLLGAHADRRYVDEAGDWRWDAHFALFDEESLTRALRSAGFGITRIQTNGHPNLQATAERVA